MAMIVIRGLTVREVKLPEIRDYFGMDSKGFAAEWRKLSSDDKEDLKLGLGTGLLTY